MTELRHVQGAGVAAGDGEAHAGRVLPCVQCGADVTVGAEPRIGEIVVCGTCSVELELISLDPPQLALAPEVEEDWGE
jgi:alpha-aminoadipate carrier protein LysW